VNGACLSSNLNCDMPRRMGVFVLNIDGGFEPRASWRTRIDALCRAVAGAVGEGAEMRYRSYRVGGGTCVGLDVSGPAGIVYMSLSLTGAVELDPATDHGDMPGAEAVHAGAELEFWVVDEVDALCLAARIRSELNQESCVVLESATGPSTKRGDADE
jgi:hypothetical protein